MINLRIPEHILDKVDSIAKEKGLTRTAMLLVMIDEYLKGE